jgi:hypothetical protein
MHISEHFFHYFLILLPFLAASLILIRSTSTLNKFRALALLVMFVFIAHHFMPSMMPGMTHDNISHTQLHPCCMPLVGTVEVITIILAFSLITRVTKTQSVSIIAYKRFYSYTNKSPPYFL